jgi:hypothetical protein
VLGAHARQVAGDHAAAARQRGRGRTGSATPAQLSATLASATGPSGRFARLAYEAEVQAFILDAMGYQAAR